MNEDKGVGAGETCWPQTPCHGPQDHAGPSRTPWGRPRGQRGEQASDYRVVGAGAHGAVAPREGAVGVRQPGAPVLSVLLCGQRRKGGQAAGRSASNRSYTETHNLPFTPSSRRSTESNAGREQFGAPSPAQVSRHEGLHALPCTPATPCSFFSGTFHGTAQVSVSLPVDHLTSPLQGRSESWSPCLDLTAQGAPAGR